MPSCENWRMFTWWGWQCDGYREPVSTLWGVMRVVTVLWHSSHSPSPGFVCPSQSSRHTSHRMQTLGSLNKTGTSRGGPSASTPHPDPGSTSPDGTWHSLTTPWDHLSLIFWKLEMWGCDDYQECKSDKVNVNHRFPSSNSWIRST